jgi:hypothetical protein
VLTPDQLAGLAEGQFSPRSSEVLVHHSFDPGGELPALVGDARLVAIDERGDPPLAEPNQTTVLELPFEGIWRVGQGNASTGTHHGFAAFSLDLDPVDDAGRINRNGGKTLEDWYCFGRPVLAAGDGVVAKIDDGQPDSPPGVRTPDWNAILIRHADGEYSQYGHLKRGSLRVRTGDTVHRGDVIAQCGNSASGTPHLHWAFIGSLDPGMTRPARFTGYEQRLPGGPWTPGQGRPQPGQELRRVQTHRSGLFCASKEDAWGISARCSSQAWA